MVVDCCRYDGVNWTVELLRRLKVADIDLFCLTHPDEDHCKGVPELLDYRLPKQVWQYRTFGTRLNVLLAAAKNEPSEKRKLLQDLQRALDALGADTVSDNSIGQQWHPQDADYTVALVAPCHGDIKYEDDRFNEVKRKLRKKEPLSDKDNELLTGNPNFLSQAIAIRWNEIGILLGGDVVYHENEPDRGWNGVLRSLEKRGESDAFISQRLVTNLHFVKIAHHGSTSSGFCDEAWRLHAQDKRVNVVGMTPCNKGKNPPPQPEIFQRLSVHAESVTLTALPQDPEFTRVIQGGWQQTKTSTAGDASCFKVTLNEDGVVDVDLFGTARHFAPTAHE